MFYLFQIVVFVLVLYSIYKMLVLPISNGLNGIATKRGWLAQHTKLRQGLALAITFLLLIACMIAIVAYCWWVTSREH